MKKIVFLFLMLTHTVSAQPSLKSLSISPTLGFAVHSHNGIGISIRGPEFFMTSPSAGINIYFRDSPFSLSLKKEWTISLNSIASNHEYLIDQKWTEQYYFLRYQLKNGLQPEIGYFDMKWENLASLIFGGSEMKGFSLGITKKINNINVNYRHKIFIHPSFQAILGWETHKLSFYYEFNSPKHLTGRAIKGIKLRGIVGTRFFPIKIGDKLGAEKYGKVGASGVFGVELLHERTNFSINLEKDFWFAINAGHYRRDLKGYLTNVTIGLKYHQKLANNHHLRFGLGYAAIRDYSLYFNIDPERIKLFKVRIPNVLGIATSIAYELGNKTDIELKNSFMVKSIDGKSGYNPMYLSLGVIYRL